MSETNVYFYSALAIFVLLIACVIFFKRSTARSAYRNKKSISIFMGFGVGWLAVLVGGRSGGGPSD